MAKSHTYKLSVEWTGNSGMGTSSYTEYGRDHVIRVEGKPELKASADYIFRGDKSRHNPEDLLVASLSACHMLWYLHLCADAGLVVLAAPADTEKANQLHHLAHEKCFISNSVNFPVQVYPKAVMR